MVDNWLNHLPLETRRITESMKRWSSCKEEFKATASVSRCELYHKVRLVPNFCKSSSFSKWKSPITQQSFLLIIHAPCSLVFCRYTVEESTPAHTKWNFGHKGHAAGRQPVGLWPVRLLIPYKISLSGHMLVVIHMLENYSYNSCSQLPVWHDPKAKTV